MTTPDMEGIREFALSSDRDSAPFFVGREEVLDNINHAWQSRMKKWQAGNRGNGISLRFFSRFLKDCLYDPHDCNGYF